MTEEEEKLECLARVLQPNFFFEVVKLLSLDDAVAFHDAFPTLWRLWHEPGAFSGWFRSHLERGEKEVHEAWKHLNVTDRFRPITFEAYVQHVHWHKHASYSPGAHPKYKTDVLQFAGMTPVPVFVVKACLFLPKSAPAPFSGNLALLGLDGELVTFRADPFSYAATSFTRLPFNPDALRCSPRGETLLLPSAAGATAAVVLGGAAPTVRVSDVSVEGSTGDCFVGEDCFLSWAENRLDLLRHRVGPDSFETSLYWDHRIAGTAFVRAAGETLFWLRQSRGEEPAHLVFAEAYGTGLGNRMRVVRDPEGERESAYLYFHTPGTSVCDCLFTPDQDVLFVMCIQRGSGKDFFTGTPPSVGTMEGEGYDPKLNEGTYGHFCFFGVTFEREWVQVTPRFFVGRYDLHDPVDHWGHLYALSACQHAAAVCTDSHLSVRFLSQGVCHFSLIATPLSQPYYATKFVRRLWTISRDHKHHAYFSGEQSSWTDTKLVGYRECSKYDRSFSAGRGLLRLPETPPLSLPVRYT